MSVATGDASCRRIGWIREPASVPGPSLPPSSCLGPSDSVRAAGLRGAGDGLHGPLEAGVVHVVVGDEAQDTRARWCPARMPSRVEVVDDRVGVGVGEDDHVGRDARRGRTRASGQRSATAWARRRARAWSSARRSTMVAQRHQPGGGDDPGLAHAAPEAEPLDAAPAP